MTKKQLIESLNELPDDATINLSTLMLVTEDDGDFNVILDYPIDGIAYHEEDKEVRLAVQTKKYKDAYHLAAFGVEVKKL